MERDSKMQTYCFTDETVLGGAYWPQVETCYSKTWAGYKMLPHMHDRVEIMYVLKGRCRIHVFTHRMEEKTIRLIGKREITLGVGDFILLDQGVLHALEVPETSYMANVEFAIFSDQEGLLSLKRLYEVSESFRGFKALGQKIVTGTDQDGLVYQALARVIESFQNAGVGKAQRDIHMCDLLLILSQHVEAASEKDRAFFYVGKAEKWMLSHADAELRVGDIAAQAGVALNYLQRIFKQVKGQTMIQYLNRIRIERSKFLLAQTEEPIVDIAAAVGYNSRQHFCRVFSAVVGVSPQRFRKDYQDVEKKQIFIFDGAQDTHLEQYHY